MTTERLLQQAKTLLQEYTKETAAPEPNRLDAVIDAADLPKAAGALRAANWGYLAALTGLDLGPEANQIEALYHICEEAAVATLRVRVPREGGAVPSIHQLHPNALFYEREFLEMFGVQVTGLPDTSRFFLPDDWPDGIYPLRKGTNPNEAASISAGKEPAEPGRYGDKFIVPIGPQHPALKEPGHFEFTVDGEEIKEARVRLGYVHRGIERATQERNYVQNLYLVERVCGICSHSHATAYVNGIEQLAKAPAPPRAQAIRQLVAELERIHSHLLWLGVASYEAGFETLLMYSWRDREIVMDILETMTGNRVNYSTSIPGGVKLDVTAEHAAAVLKGLAALEERCKHYLHVVTEDTSFLSRAQGIGTMSKAQADSLELMGPTGRASGVRRDVRVNAPYGSYPAFPANLIVDAAGDLAARFKVRMLETLDSIRMCREILNNLPAGELAVKFPRRIPAGETVSRFEAPRGELFYFIKSNGTDMPERVKIRTPSLCNWIYVITKAPGAQLADVPPLLAGIDPCFSCNDRMVTLVNPSHGDRRVLTWDAFRRLAKGRGR
jgi:NADH-quinone oxidoreductase subunit D